MKTDERITLSDGRALAYAEFGDRSGHPVLYFHGSPSSRLEPLMIGDDVLVRLGLRVIAPDRPGMGGSDFQSGRGFSDWPADVTSLADALGLARFSVMGNSGGGPYVAVCGVRIPERLLSAVIVSGGWRMDTPEAKAGLPFPNRMAMLLAKRAPWLLKILLASMGGVAASDPDKELAQLAKRMPPADVAAFAEPGRLEAFGRTMRECLRQGAKGATWDMRLFVRDFGFRPEEIRVPLTWFHGEADTNAPIAMVRKATASIPDATLVTYPGEAHLSTLVQHIDAIAAALVQPEAAPMRTG